MIRIDLDTVPKWRNQSEWRPVNRARAEDHSVIIALCKRLVADGYDPKEAVEVWWGHCMAFCPGSLGTWASGGGWVGKQPEWLKKGQKAH